MRKNYFSLILIGLLTILFFITFPWVGVVLLILLAYGIYKVRSQFRYFEPQMNEGYYQQESTNQKDDMDIIDVEFTESDVE